MDENELIRKLNSLGKEAFVTHFDLFKNYVSGQISRNIAIDELVKLGVSNNSGVGIRVGNAKLIFEAKLDTGALDIILDSRRLSSSVVNKARKLRSAAPWQFMPEISCSAH